ncbi:MAG TPA: SRPBCC domain-containing protein [Myxococcaceae bacterium]|nr:SRPBCC domain-containing protein [Myxococcaceae bacterium]
MASEQLSLTSAIARSVVINARAAAVWDALTNPELMRQWLGEPEMRIEVVTDWAEGSPILIRGFHHAKFENKGTVLRFEPLGSLRYSHLSSLSRLPDRPESYSVFDFRLKPLEEGTSLTVTVTGFPTESIFKHLDFYWRGTIVVLKRFVEKNVDDAANELVR